MSTHALLFDLDNTLLLEDEVTFGAVRTACERAAERADRERLFAAVVRIADDLWRAAPTLAYADRMGIWWGEGLWGEFKGDRDGLRALREFVPVFRREVWRDALADCGVVDPDLAGAARVAIHLIEVRGEVGVHDTAVGERIAPHVASEARHELAQRAESIAVSFELAP